VVRKGLPAAVVPAILVLDRPARERFSIDRESIDREKTT